MTDSTLGILAVLLFSPAAGQEAYPSHPPMRPLPQASKRLLASGIAHFVDARTGNDSHEGSGERPWKTVQYAVRRLTPGDTLYLRGGTYYERVTLTESGQPDKPITVRSFPGELAILDGGIPEFHENPKEAWEPFVGGAEGEYVSKKTYPEFDRRRIEVQFISDGWEPFYGIESERPLVLGHFGDSMVPLHGYRSIKDLRAAGDGVWKGKSDKENGLYWGPGVWYERKTGRIHIRLAHTPGQGPGEYRGATDPRTLRLVIAGGYGEDVLRINGLKHVRLQDLVLRGASGSALINLYGSEDVEFDHLTVYGGSPSLLAKSTKKLRVSHCAFRSLAAPWSSRASMKYRGTPSYVIVTQQTQPMNRDWEFAFNEFTDGHDFFWMRYVKNLRFHRNFVDNFNDDGLEVGAKTRDHEIYIHDNRVSRCLLTLTAHEIHKDESPLATEPKSGVYVYRNIFDFRQEIQKEATASGKPIFGELTGDHGGPVWAQFYFYHNTVLRPEPSFRNYYGLGIGGRGLRQTRRGVFNNIFAQSKGNPGLQLPLQPAEVDLQADGNLFWVGEEKGRPEAPFSKFRQSKAFEESKKQYAPGWTAHDVFADPQFSALAPDGKTAADLSLKAGSPAVNAGVPIPSEWPDSRREPDAPDLGAIPLGAAPWRVGVDERLSVCPGPIE